MTEDQKTKLLRELAKENMTREQITAFCAEQAGHNGEGEIDLLCNEKLIDMVSKPCWDHGVFIPKSYDLFGIADCGKDRLADIGKERFRLYLPIIISILSVVVALASFIVSLIALVKSG